ncbi:hypothetical protein [Peterkaempfera griseoplana]|uniref:hypothetical protein n=1 Tax=Peterkaempfera griseoplana TaxID=66896 RepID=UPI0006E35D1A|nr:hypothetical protein [Peterkaempfera griseoplana]
MNRFALRAGAAAAALTLGGAALTPVLAAAANGPSSSPSSVAAAAVRPARAAQIQRIEDLPARTVAADGRSHEVSVEYHGTFPAARTASVQLLVEGAGGGSGYLSPGQVRVERLDAAGHRWRSVRLGCQTGTLYTAVRPTGGTLVAGGELHDHYRVTAVRTSATPRLLLQPRLLVH